MVTTCYFNHYGVRFMRKNKQTWSVMTCIFCTAGSNQLVLSRVLVIDLGISNYIGNCRADVLAALDGTCSWWCRRCCCRYHWMFYERLWELIHRLLYQQLPGV